VKHLFKTLNISKYHIYEGKDIERLQVFIEVASVTFEEANEQVSILSNALEEKMLKSWKYFPSTFLPKEYNIITLPYKEI
jgi:hypothetical protein